MKLTDWPEENRPRERLQKAGPKALSDAELLAIILQKGTKQENVIEVANRLISKYTLQKLSECSLKELQEIKGIGFAKACQILALFEFNKRHNLAKTPTKKITCAKDVFNLFHEKLKDEKQENFYILMLDTKNKIIGEKLITKGTLDTSIIHPREVFKEAIKNSASKIILVHNHPSGDPKPSSQDMELTKKLSKSSKLLDIQLLDHIIIGKENHFSLREQTVVL